MAKRCGVCAGCRYGRTCERTGIEPVPNRSIKPRPITLSDLQAGGVFHHNACEPGRVERWRSNGKVKTWVTRPDQFRAPVKHGLYSYGYITELEVNQFHREQDCPYNL